MEVADEIIRELTKMVWTTVLGLDAEDTAPAEASERADEITTSVDISGSWSGTVSISFSRPLGKRLASAMLAVPESEATPALVQDVVGELANVIGGNVKGVLPGPCKLSLPRVEVGSQQSAEGETRLWFDCVGEPFCVTVCERKSELRSES
jgi:chemotaxis protein CheX